MSTATKMKPAKKSDENSANLPDEKTLKALVNVFKSLADPHRLKILLTLANCDRLHVSAICDELGQSQPAVSHHLTQLKNAGLVEFDRKGKFNYYRLSSELVRDIVMKFFPNCATSQQKATFGDLEVTFKINK